jgi:hypothetical protein
VSECPTGCKRRGEHVEACRSDECRGCMPRAAEFGLLCGWCWQRLATDLAGIPSLVEHLREMGKPYAQTEPPGDGRSYRDPAFLDAMPAPWLAADELESLVASWALVVLEEHPVQPMRGPKAGPWHGDVVAWLTPHLPWCAEQEWAAEMRRELARDTSTLRARWPMPEDVEPRKSVDVPCPRCDSRSLTYTPPRGGKHPFVVECGNPDCARVFSEDEWERFRALALISAERTLAPTATPERPPVKVLVGHGADERTCTCHNVRHQSKGHAYWCETRMKRRTATAEMR